MDVLTLGPLSSPAALFVALLLGAAGLPFPEEAVLALAGVMLARDPGGAGPVLLAIVAGLFITDNTLYALGRVAGRRLPRVPLLGRVITAARLEHLGRRFDEDGPPFLVAGRQVLGVRTCLFVAAGATGMSWPRFALTDACGALLSIACWASVGFVGGQVRPVYAAALGLTFAALALGASSAWKRRTAIASV